MGTGVRHERTSSRNTSDDGSAGKTTRRRTQRKPNGHEVDLEYLTFGEFQKANPPSFRGAFNPDKAEEWIKAMEKVFSILACTNYQRATFATYMLEAGGMA